MLISNFINKNIQDIYFFIESTEDDSVVPISDIDDFVDILNENDISVEYKRDSGDDHNWTYWVKATKNGYKWALESFK